MQRSGSGKYMASRLEEYLDEISAPEKFEERIKILAAQLGESIFTTRLLLEGHTLPEMKKIEAIADKLEVDVKWLTGLDLKIAKDYAITNQSPTASAIVSAELNFKKSPKELKKNKAATVTRKPAKKKVMQSKINAKHTNKNAAKPKEPKKTKLQAKNAKNMRVTKIASGRNSLSKKKQSIKKK